MTHWTTALVATDLVDPATGEPLYVQARIRPRWYWRLRRVWLFVRIVWRPWHADRLSWRLAWEVSGIVSGGISHGE